MTTAVVKFCFDIVCPFAYIASTRVNDAFPSDQCRVRWTPTLLGGLYRNSAAPQGKDGSATKVMSPAKRQVVASDLALQAARFGVRLSFNERHPIKTLNAMRLLTYASEERRPALAAALYRAYWVKGEDVSDERVLDGYARAAGLDLAAALADERVKRELTENTAFASDRGAFGVPVVFVERTVSGGPPADAALFWGGDRLHFAAAAAGLPAALPRVRPFPAPAAPRVTVRFYFDTSSPWSFLGFTQLARLAAVARIEAVPVLVGAIFRALGGPMLPAAAMSDAKRAWSQRDLGLWQRWHHEPMRWPDQFPLRTVLAQRCIAAEPSAAGPLFRAAWQRNLDIGRREVVLRVLDDAGFDGEALVARAGSAEIKARLRRNVEQALERGVIGVPSYEVLLEGGREPLMFWGQDRLDTVLDLACGWRPDGTDRAAEARRVARL